MYAKISVLGGLLFSVNTLAATFNFNVAESEGCEFTANAVCEPVIEYRVYERTNVGDTLVASNPSFGSFIASWPATTGEEICFVATAYNGLESVATAPSCVTPTLSRPNPPGGIVVTFE